MRLHAAAVRKFLRTEIIARSTYDDFARNNCQHNNSRYFIVNLRCGKMLILAAHVVAETVGNIKSSEYGLVATT